MNNTWYYSECDKSVGPLSLVDLTAVLSRVSDARDVLVWRNGFSGWVRAENVPELAAQIVKPPPLMQELEPVFPTMSMAARLGKGVLYASAIVLGIFLAGYLFGDQVSSEVYFGFFFAYMWGWLNGTKRIGVKRPKKWSSLETWFVAPLCALAFLIYVAATQGTSSWLFRFSISFFIVLAGALLVGPAARWINRQF